MVKILFAIAIAWQLLATFPMIVTSRNREKVRLKRESLTKVQKRYWLPILLIIKAFTLTSGNYYTRRLIIECCVCFVSLRPLRYKANIFSQNHFQNPIISNFTLDYRN